MFCQVGGSGVSCTNFAGAGCNSGTTKWYNRNLDWHPRKRWHRRRRLEKTQNSKPKRLTLGSRQPQKARKKRPKTSRKKHDNQVTDDEEDGMCLVCIELYFNSRPGEKWVLCIQCKGWAHEEYPDIGFVLTFTCQKCNSGDSDNAY